MSSQDDEQQKAARLREAVLKEILETEEGYVSQLYTLILYFITPLKNGKFPEISANPKGDVLEEIAKPAPMIGNVFLTLTSNLSLYSVYCNHQAGASDTIDQCLKTSSTFKQFIDRCVQEANTKGLGILDFIIKPFQRILKYPLLLKELLKNTPDNAADRQSLMQALEKIQQEVDTINKNKAKSENFQKMLEIQQNVESIPKHFKFLIPSRKFLYEGTLMKISGPHNQERQFFLFNDCLMYAKKKGAGKYICRGIIFLNKLQIEEMTEENSFKIHRTDKGLTYVLIGKNFKEKETWLFELKRAMGKTTSSSFVPSSPGKPQEKTTVIRLYVSKDQFKSLAVTKSMTTTDVCVECAKKLKLNDVDNFERYKICLVVNGRERLLMPNEKPVEVQENLTKMGAKFGGPEDGSAHFKVTILNDKNLDFYKQATIRASAPVNIQNGSYIISSGSQSRSLSPQPPRTARPTIVDKRPLSPPPPPKRPISPETRSQRQSRSMTSPINPGSPPTSSENLQQSRSDQLRSSSFVERPKKALPPPPPPPAVSSSPQTKEMQTS